VGLLAGGGAAGLIPLTIVALALFWLRTPVEIWAGATPIRARTARELRQVQLAAMLLSAASILGLIWLFWGRRNGAMLSIGGAAAISFLMQAILRRNRRTARTLAQMVGAAGLTATAPAAYYVVTGSLNATAFSLWGANLLFAMNQIHFVQLRIHAARVADRRQKLELGRNFLIGQILLAALIFAACARGAFPWFAAVAFLPALARGFGWFAARPKPLAVHALGKSELAYACAFGLLLVVGMGLGR
jgi:hypothetical protein